MMNRPTKPNSQPRLFWGTLACAITAALALGDTDASAQSAGSKRKEPIVIQQHASVYPTAKNTTAAVLPAHYTVNQIYFQYQIPTNIKKGSLPLIMVHG